jgi:hypothetical protein
MIKGFSPASLASGELPEKGDQPGLEKKVNLSK